MRKLYLALLVIAIAISSGIAMAASLPKKIAPTPIHGITIELQPENAGTLTQSIDSCLSGATTPEELYEQSCRGFGDYDLREPVFQSGQWLPWYSELSPPCGMIFRYRGFLRYDTSGNIPKNAIILKASLKLYHCEEIISNGRESFGLTLNKCRFESVIDYANASVNFDNAFTTITSSIDLGLSSSIPYNVYQVAIPRQWINRCGHTDMSILSEQESNNCFAVGEQTMLSLLWWSEYPTIPTKTYRPTLVVEYIELHRARR